MLAVLNVWVGLIAALFYLPLSEDEPSWPRTIVKTLPLLFFAYAALLQGRGSVLIAGLLLSALGDLALSRNGEKAFLAGLSAFALAHLAYVFHFLNLSGAPIWSAFSINLPLALFLLLHAALTEFWLVPHTGALKWPVRVYVLLITLMGLAALTLPIGVAFLGAGFFIFSDSLLALRMFRMVEDDPLSGRMGWAVWISYISGQAMILAA